MAATFNYSSVIEGKRQLRNLVGRLKREFTSVNNEMEREATSEKIMHKVEQLPQFQNAKVILAYHSLPDEVYTHLFLLRHALEKTILLPKVVGETLTLHGFQQESDLSKGAFGIKEPNTPKYKEYALIDMVVVPGVAFDRSGKRLGRGRGYYDRLFSDLLPEHVFKVGVCYGFQLFDDIPAEPMDVPMHMVLSE